MRTVYRNDDLPDPGDFPCEVCGRFEDNCICPECPECGALGDQLCYEKHGLIRTREQIDSLAAAEAEWKEQARAEAEYEAEYLKWETNENQS